jgi:hypothetical protein
MACGKEWMWPAGRPENGTVAEGGSSRHQEAQCRSVRPGLLSLQRRQLVSGCPVLCELSALRRVRGYRDIPHRGEALRQETSISRQPVLSGGHGI